ncbi:MAG: Gfo/Idh/MocA family protein [Dysgonomonas sp.]
MSKLLDTVRWGIIGCGDVCEKKSGPAFYNIKHSALTAVMRRDEDKAKDFALRHGVKQYYTDADSLINDPNVDIVYIATPPASHKEYTIKALQAGKSVYVEKPMAINFAECEEMIRIADETKQKLFVAFYRRSMSYFVKIKELLDTNAIGKVLTVDVKMLRAPQASDLTVNTQTWRVDKNIAGDGYFYDLAPHTLDILDYFLGEIVDAKGYRDNLSHLYESSDTVSAIFKFKSGVQGIGQWSFTGNENYEEDSVIVRGTMGEIEFGTFNFKPIILKYGSEKKLFEISRPECVEQELIQTIVSELRGTGECPSTAISAARTSWVMDMIMK